MSFTITKKGKMKFEKDKFCPNLNDDNSCKIKKELNSGKIIDEKILLKFCLKRFVDCEFFIKS